VTDATSTRGRPKVPWTVFEDEVFRRLVSGEAAETVQSESKYIHKWAVDTKAISANQIGPERIRERIKKRYKGSEGYKLTRQFHRNKLGLS